MEISVSRMENLRLKKRVKTAEKGHKLLKDKQDELMRHFLGLIDEIKGLRHRTERELIDAMRRFVRTNGSLSEKEREIIYTASPYKPKVEIDTKILMNIKLPVFELNFEKAHTYSLLSSPADTDFALRKAQKALEILLKLSEAEKKMELIADELDKTRRRVNALEHILIPDLNDTIKYINMKLEEMERGNLTRLMKVKEMLEEKKSAVE
ncbi:MAG: V-type ATP synthase subunit D [Candidatus Zixiibacteriota bacterium]